MASPPIPPSLEPLAGRPFSFYPPILNVEQNEWIFRKATWSEVLVANRKNGAEIWIPRRFFGEISRIDEPVLIVGLLRELEYKGGAVWPYQRRVIEMPMAVGAAPQSAEAPPERAPASIVGIRLEASDRRMARMVVWALAVGLAFFIVAANLNRVAELRRHNVVFTARDQAFLELSGHDDYTGVVQKLGKPASERSSEMGTLYYRALGYPERKYTVILMGNDEKTAQYIGTVDDNWKPVHSVELRGGGTTSSLLRALRRF